MRNGFYSHRTPGGTCPLPQCSIALFAFFLVLFSDEVLRGAELSPKETESAHKLYVAKCAKCHKFYDPAKYSTEEWNIWMKKMSRKSKLKPDQEKLLSTYIENNLRLPGQTRKTQH